MKSGELAPNELVELFAPVEPNALACHGSRYNRKRCAYILRELGIFSSSG